MIDKSKVEEKWIETNSTVMFIPATTLPDMPITAVKLYAIIDNRLLLTKVPRGWDIPGGHIEPDETPEDAVIREIKEEAGLMIDLYKIIGYLKAVNTPSENNKLYPRLSAIIIYGALNPKIISETLIDSEATDARWIQLSTVPEYHHNWSELKELVVKEVFERFSSDV